MELTEAQIEQLEAGRETLELAQDPKWIRFRTERLETAIAKIERTLATQKMDNWDEYLALWNRRAALRSVLGEFDTAQSTVNDLTKKMAEEPDMRPATGA